MDLKGRTLQNKREWCGLKNTHPLSSTTFKEVVDLQIWHYFVRKKTNTIFVIALSKVTIDLRVKKRLSNVLADYIFHCEKARLGLGKEWCGPKNIYPLSSTTFKVAVD